jgi:3-hydroxyacyl-CoA dehydrogenase / enoyl-CoA hydratase / 3-hydroxybutyryl-CoA epimerase
LTKEAAAMIRSLFISMQELNKGAAPPDRGRGEAGDPKIAIIGAGFMGAGIAEVSARAGIDVVLLDRDEESAEKGKATVEAAYKKHVAKAA